MTLSERIEKSRDLVDYKWDGKPFDLFITKYEARPTWADLFHNPDLTAEIMKENTKKRMLFEEKAQENMVRLLLRSRY